MSFTIDADLAVVGAGPAGLSAALAAANAGARVVRADEYAEPGGQFYKQLPAEFSVPDRAQLDDDYTKGDALLARSEEGRRRRSRTRRSCGARSSPACCRSGAAAKRAV